MRISERISNSDRRISVLLVSQIYNRATIAIIATAMNATIILFILWDLISSRALVVWYFLTMLAAMIRFIQIKKFQRTSDPLKNIRYWTQLMVIGMGISGILWGSTAIFLFPVDSTAHQAFIAIVLAGMVAGAVGVLSPIMSVFLTFSIPALAPIFCRFMIIGDTLHMAIGFMTLVFGILTFSTAKRVNSTINELISLRLTFEDQLEERTAELKKVNEQLQQEIEERRQAEKALRESETKYRRITENISDVVWITDLDLKYVYVSPSVERLFGEPVDAYMNKTLEERFPPDSLDKIYSIFAEELEKEQDPPSDKKRTRVIEAQRYRADGSKIWVSMNVSFLRDENGNPVGIQGVTRDVTEQKKAGEALKENTQLLQNILNHMHDLVSLNDLNGNFKFVSASHKILGYDPGFLIGKNIMEFVHPDDLPKLSSVFEKYLVSRKNEGKVEYRYRCADGSYLFFETIGKFLRDKDGISKEILFSTRDITEKKLAEKEREKLQSQLNQIQKVESVGRLAGGVAHDFNNMLGVIIGYTELAMEKISSDSSLYNDLAEIITAAKRSTDITRQLLAFARKQTISPIVCDLNEVVESMLKIIRRLIGENIDLVWLPESGLWRIKIDPAQIDQILANLCVNARDAISGVGKVIIDTENVTLGENYCSSNAGFLPGDYVLMTVSDNGCGMTKEILDNIFEPFYTTKGVGKGTGLGISTVYGIIKQNNGFINVYSEPGKGSTFKIYLPRYSGETVVTQQEISKKVPTGHGETILLVEDEPAMMNMGKMMLEKLGYQVLAANTPGEALRLAGENSDVICLLLTDVIMPEMNGRDLADQIQHLFPNIKTLFMSGYTADVIAHHGVLDQGVNFIQKPFSKKDIAVKIKTMLGK
jgi:two-component system, cell cycle sensor histidine kinase and response regulator CckA